jgi:hypothetical protein
MVGCHIVMLYDNKSVAKPNDDNEDELESGTITLLLPVDTVELKHFDEGAVYHVDFTRATQRD